MASSLPFEPTSVRTSANGLIALWHQAPLAYTRVRGHFHRDHAQALIQMVDSIIARGTMVEQFHDWGDMTSFDIACQKDLTLWTVSVRHKVKKLTILVNSPVVAMGVKVANVPLRGMIHVCENREEFDRVFLARLGRDMRQAVSA